MSNSLNFMPTKPSAAYFQEVARRAYRCADRTLLPDPRGPTPRIGDFMLTRFYTQLGDQMVALSAYIASGPAICEHCKTEKDQSATLSTLEWALLDKTPDSEVAQFTTVEMRQLLRNLYAEIKDDQDRRKPEDWNNMYSRLLNGAYDAVLILQCLTVNDVVNDGDGTAAYSREEKS